MKRETLTVLENQFLQLDEGRDGFIDRKEAMNAPEVREWMSLMQIDEQEALDMFFNKFDQNKDGRISQAEFMIVSQ